MFQQLVSLAFLWTQNKNPFYIKWWNLCLSIKLHEKSLSTKGEKIMQQYIDIQEAIQDRRNGNLSREVAEGNVELRSYHYTNELNVILIWKLLNIVPSRRDNSDTHYTCVDIKACFNGTMQNTSLSQLRNLCLTVISNSILF